MDNSIPVLIALGPNEIQIPCRIFNCSLQEAVKKCKKLLEAEPRKTRNGSYIFRSRDWNNTVPTGGFNKRHKVIEREKLDYLREQYGIVKVVEDNIVNGQMEYESKDPAGNIRMRTTRAYHLMDVPDEELVGIYLETPITRPKRSIIADKVFTSYYGGAGEVDSYILKNIKFDEPFVRFNLD